MKALVLLMSMLAFSVNAAEPERLALWVTEPIGMTNGSQCVLQPSAALPSTPPALTEKDVAAWNPTEGKWKLDPTRFAGDQAAGNLQDRCFVLAIDGKLVNSGLALAPYSARLSGFPTLIVSNKGNEVTLQLLSGNHGTRMRLLHTDALGQVFQSKAESSR